MRIIIEIEGANVTITAPGAVRSPIEPLAGVPPSGLLEAAARVGALSAGPAPAAVLEAAGMAVRPLRSGLEALAAPDATDAGKAPAPSSSDAALGTRGPAKRRAARKTRAIKRRR
jgi:hypothetical protein